VNVDIWIGANDRDQEDDFEWADGQPVTFFNWAMGQPDNFQGQENCVEIRALDEQWNDRPCGGDPQEYLCER
jgi:C-type mannose receptor